MERKRLDWAHLLKKRAVNFDEISQSYDGIFDSVVLVSWMQLWLQLFIYIQICIQGKQMFNSVE